MFKGITRELEGWKDFYPDAADTPLRKKFEPLGGPVIIGVYLDANHTGSLANRSSQSGILIYGNNKFINFYSKR